MSARKSATNWFSRWKSSPRTVSLLIVGAAFLGMLALKYAGLLQSLEFQAYDYFIRRQPKVASSEPIVLVEMTEADIHNPSLDYPIYDDKLAQLLSALAADQPAVIGLDIWRDIPVPKSGVGLNEFNGVLKSNLDIVPIFSMGGGIEEGKPIAPPPALGMDPARVAFNDNFPPDVEVDHTIPKVRRSLLFCPAPSGEVFTSLPCFLAQHYLQKRGIEMEQDPEDQDVLILGKGHLRKFHSNDGAYVGADARGWQMLLDFKCPDDFTRLSVGDALSGKIPPGSLKDKIVLVGINTASVMDERVTPVRRNHKGIEVQALTINQLLRVALDGEKPLQSWTGWQENVWILLWCLVGGAIGYRVSSPWRFALENVACLAIIGAAAWFAFSIGWWIPLGSAALAYVPPAILVTSYIISHERSMREVLMKLYSRHVSKKIAENIWEHRESFLEGQRPLAQKLVVTVLFTDLKGFSTISEKMTPPQLYGWLNGYLGAMAQVVESHGGVLKQFTGDGILALFGVPVPHTKQVEQEDDASAAVRCALAMGRRLVDLSHEWREAGLPAVSMRAGIYTGEVAAGSVGSDDRFEYAVIGDVVNTASRLESYDKSLADPDALPNRCRILIGEPTHRLLNDKFVSKQIGMLKVKGKAIEVSVFLILDERVEGVHAAAPETTEQPIVAGSAEEKETVGK